MKYGISNFTIEFVEIINDPTAELLMEREGFWIEAAEGNNYYNILPAGLAGPSFLGRTHSDESKAKMSSNSTKRKLVKVQDILDNTNYTYPSITAAAQALNCSRQNVYNV